MCAGTKAGILDSGCGVTVIKKKLVQKYLDNKSLGPQLKSSNPVKKTIGFIYSACN